MKWLKSFFGGSPAAEKANVSRQVTHSDPLVIQNPKIGFLNLIGASASPLVHEDMTALHPLFSGCVQSDDDAPICDVLMIYATIKADGMLQNTTHSLRDIIGKSHAPIVVVATENSVESYIAASKGPGSGKANLVMTLQRKGPIFPDFFKELFGMMHRGVTMPMAWVKLAPQIPGREHENVPGTICAMEVTHVLFQ
ncbi:MAG TPA: hypothetical protein VFQ41_05015 [Candidatus Angelobacter sp.]|nr:hypothetical protein [Candidatus Angelobacter sp.]